MLNPIRAIKGIKSVIQNQPAELADCDIVAGYIVNDNAQQRLTSEQYDLFYKKWLAYHFRTTPVKYSGFDDFAERLVLIVAEFSECGDYRTFLYADAGSHLMLENRIPLVMGKRDEIIGKMNDVYNVFQQWKQKRYPNRSINNLAFMHCLTWYYSTIVAMIINNVSSGKIDCIAELYKRNLHEDITDLEFWHAIRSYRRVLIDAAKDKPYINNDEILLMQKKYSSEIGSILLSRKPIMQKCRDLSIKLLATFGLNIEWADLDSSLFLDGFTPFITYVKENKM